MKQLSRILIILAVLCVAIAVLSKAVGGNPVPRIPLNWLKIADTALLFSIALSILGIKEK